MSLVTTEFNKRERILKGNEKYTIQRNWQPKEHNTKKNKTQAQHNMCWTPL